MITIQTDSEKTRVSEQRIAKLTEKLKNRQEELRSCQQKATYTDDCSSINLPFDKDNIKKITSLSKQYTCDVLIVVGIGGSNLGTVAVHEAVQTKLHNDVTDETKVYFADTTHPVTLQEILGIIKEAHERDERVVINAVSKSGGTTETIANFELLSEALREKKEWYNDVIVTTTKGSAFDKYADNNNIESVYIPQRVGGRYSVLSAVGILPLTILGINIPDLLQGARHAVKQSLNTENILRSAAIRYAHLDKASHNTFLFDSDLESLGKWHRQLLGESLGKQGEGINPTVSIGSTDLHSVAQYYLGGPKNEYHEIVEVQNYTSPTLPQREEFEKLVEDIQGKPIYRILSSIVGGVKKTFETENIPFTTSKLQRVNEHTVGGWMQYKMIETMLVGYLMDIDPFTQPHVELYKEETKRLLQE